MLLSAVTTPVRASVQTGEPPNLAREGDPIGLTAEAGGFARPNHGLTTVVTGHGLRYPVEISENSRYSPMIVPGRSGYHQPLSVPRRRRGFSREEPFPKRAVEPKL